MIQLDGGAALDVAQHRRREGRAGNAKHWAGTREEVRPRRESGMGCNCTALIQEFDAKGAGPSRDDVVIASAKLTQSPL